MKLAPDSIDPSAVDSESSALPLDHGDSPNVFCVMCVMQLKFTIAI